LGEFADAAQDRPDSLERVGQDDHEEAVGWVAEKINALRAMRYDELRHFESKPLHEEMRADSGELLILETVVCFDDRDEQNLRVMVDVWRPKRWGIIIGSLARDDFIIAPAAHSSESSPA
jgi:hypothetical protein